MGGHRHPGRGGHMRVGLLGLGRIGAFHAETLAAHPLVEDLIVHDADGARTARVTSAPGVRAGDPFETDAVVIATPTATHAALLTTACERGVPVFCEKPVAPGARETAEVMETAKQTGTLVHIGFQRRFDAGYRAARAALRAGEL